MYTLKLIALTELISFYPCILYTAALIFIDVKYFTFKDYLHFNGYAYCSVSKKIDYIKHNSKHFYLHGYDMKL